MVRSQVRRGRPGRRLQSLGNQRIDVYRALDVSCELPIRATCRKKRSHLVWMSGSNCGGEPARSRTSAVVAWVVDCEEPYGTDKQTNGWTDGQAKPALQPIKTAV